MCLSIENGGINVICLYNFIETKRITFVHNIIKCETENWNMIGKHWLRYLDKKYDSENFLYQCSNTKGVLIAFLSQFYKAQYSHGFLSEANYKLVI